MNSAEGKRMRSIDGPKISGMARLTGVLNWMLDNDQTTWGVREIARGMGLPPSTTHRSLTALQDLGFVEQDADGRYRLGMELFRLGTRAVARFPYRELVSPILEQLTGASHESSLFGVFDEKRLALMYVASHESDHPLRYVVALDKWIPVDRAASWMAVLSYLPDEVLRRVLTDRSFRAEMARADVTDRAMLAELEEVRRNGYAWTVSRRIPGAVGIAAPVWSRYSAVPFGVIAVTIPEHRLSRRELKAITSYTRDAAHAATELFGGSRSTKSATS